MLFSGGQQIQKKHSLRLFWSEQQVFKYRYERLRGVAGRIQNALGDLATMGERVQSLLSWRDPRYGAFSLLLRSVFWAFSPGACY